MSCIDFDGDGKIDVCVVSTSAMPGCIRIRAIPIAKSHCPGLKGGIARWHGPITTRTASPICCWQPRTGRSYSQIWARVSFATTRSCCLVGLPQDAVASINADGDGKPDILVATAFNGLRLYRNNPPADLAAKLAQIGPWMLIGPSPNQFDTVYPPEKRLTSKSDITENSGKVAWRKTDFKDATINNLAIFGKPELNNDAVCYVAREITATGTTEIPISLGSDDGLAVFVNGERVLADNQQRAVAHGSEQTDATAQTGQEHGPTADRRAAAIGPSIRPVSRRSGRSAASMMCRPNRDSDRRALRAKHTARRWRSPTSMAMAGPTSSSAGNGLLFTNTGQPLRMKADSGIAFDSSMRADVFDFDGDGNTDLFVPQNGKSKLFRNDGKGHFTDIIDQCGDLAKSIAGTHLRSLGRFQQRRPSRSRCRLFAWPKSLSGERRQRQVHRQDGRDWIDDARV